MVVAGVEIRVLGPSIVVGLLALRLENLSGKTLQNFSHRRATCDAPVQTVSTTPHRSFAVTPNFKIGRAKPGHLLYHSAEMINMKLIKERGRLILTSF